MKEDDQNLQLNQAEEVIKQRIFLIRGQRVMLDSDLAKLYGITTKGFNRAIKRNLLRFPLNFMFQLTPEELESLRYQIGTSKIGRGGRRYLPYVFTEHGVAMLSAVLNTEKAIKMSIFIIQAFIRMREILLGGKNNEIRIGQLEVIQSKQEEIIEEIVKVLRELTDEPVKPKGPMGFVA
jgi:phage regulator Rha-like protein